MPRPRSDAVFVATETFMCEIDGEQIVVQRGETRVRSGHKLLSKYRGYFQPAEMGVHFDVEQATAAPGEKRGAQSV